MTPNPYRNIQVPDGRLVTPQRVSTVIGLGMPKPRLHEWELREIVKWAGPGFEGRDYTDHEAKRIVQEWRREQAHRYAQRGTDVHALIASALRTGEVPDVPDALRGYWSAFLGWIDPLGLHRPTYVDPLERRGHIEQTLLSEDETVAGTADRITVDGLLVTWKTSEKHTTGPAWPDNVAQVGAYASMAWTVSAPPTRKVTGPAPKVTEAMVVRLCATGRYVECPVDVEEAREVWTAVRRVAKAVGG